MPFPALQAFLIKITGRSDLMVAVLVVSVIFMMILPLPTEVIDVLVGSNMGISVILLMLAIYIGSPLEFSAFPAVLLLTTLFRLALSISITRLILLQADAGQIVSTFGNFVVAGNLIVGAVIFLIITIVQFLVITKGAERVAEVSARFSLDAMPGKQMSIDGDMRAGVIDVDEARRRRQMVEKESQLYGSMDGAMKFVKGDAIAGLIIIVVNIIGGLSIGVFQRGMELEKALHTYSILTIGDGLVAQIPALLIAITAGIIVTRVSTGGRDDLGKEISGQITGQPRALFVGGMLLVGFSMVPGFPVITFLALALVVGGGGFLMMRFQKREAERLASEDSNTLPAMAASGQRPSRSKLSEQEEFTFSVPLLIDVDASMQDHVDSQSLNEELLKVRRALYLDLGVPFPGIYLRFNEQLLASDKQYVVLMQEIPVVEGLLRPGYVLYADKPEQLELLNIAVEKGDEFLPNLPSLWVQETHSESMNKVGLSFLTTPQILTFHLSYVLKKYAEDFVGIQETRYILEQMEERFGELVKETQRVLPIHTITEVLQRLVAEDVSIRNMRLVLESLVEWGQKEKDVVLLTEYVRGSLKRYISYKFSNGQNILPAYLLDQGLEETIRGAIRQTSSGSYLTLDSGVTRELVARIKQAVGDISNRPHKPVLLTSMDIRRYVRRIIEMDVYDLSVLSYEELTQEITIQPMDKISLA